MTATTADYKHVATNKNLDHIPGSFGMPLVGQTFSLLKDFDGTIDRQVKQYGPVCQFRLTGFKGVLVLGPDIYQHILLDKERNFSAEMGYADSLGLFYRGALLLRDFDEHRFQRRMMQTAFKNNAMRGYMNDMAPLFDTAFEQWEKDPDFHFVPGIKQNLLDIAAKIFVGLSDMDGDAEKLNTAFHDISEGMMAIVKKEFPFGKFKQGKRGQRFLHAFFADLIEERRAGDGTDMFSHFTREKNEDGEYFSDEDIIRHMTFLLFAAHDTTTSTLSHIMYYLGKDQQLQQRIRDEVSALSKPVLDYEDLDTLELCDAAVKEALRLHPSVQLQQRRTIRECELGGYTIPANTIVFLAQSYHHRAPELWSDPHRYDIDRWLAPRSEHKRHSFGFIGFGGGAHKCIGMHFALMNSKMFLHQFLSRYRVTLSPKATHQFNTIPLPKPADGLPLIIEKL